MKTHSPVPEMARQLPRVKVKVQPREASKRRGNTHSGSGGSREGGEGVTCANKLHPGAATHNVDIPSLLTTVKKAKTYLFTESPRRKCDLTCLPTSHDLASRLRNFKPKQRDL